MMDVIDDDNIFPPSMPYASDDLEQHRPSLREEYEIDFEEDIGTGAASAVYKAAKKKVISLANGAFVAVKIVDREHAATKRYNIPKEVSILRSLDHPNIIKCLDFFEEPMKFCIVFELANGGELYHRVVKRKYYTEKEARDVVVEVLKAIEYCHSMNIVHRDLKPENILYASPLDDKAIKIIDFGLAERIEGTGDCLYGFCGSSGYFAPEILCHRLHGRGVDMWSIGVIVYVLLGGELPFDHPGYPDRTEEMHQHRIIRGNFEFEPQRWSLISDEAKSLISGLLTVDTSHRLSVQEALNHPWIRLDDQSLTQRDLTTTNLLELRKFNDKRPKLKAVVRHMITASRWHNMSIDYHRGDITEAVSYTASPLSSTSPRNSSPRESLSVDNASVYLDEIDASDLSTSNFANATTLGNDSSLSRRRFKCTARAVMTAARWGRLYHTPTDTGDSTTGANTIGDNNSGTAAAFVPGPDHVNETPSSSSDQLFSDLSRRRFRSTARAVMIASRWQRLAGGDSGSEVGSVSTSACSDGPSSSDITRIGAMEEGDSEEGGSAFVSGEQEQEHPLARHRLRTAARVLITASRWGRHEFRMDTDEPPEEESDDI